MKVSVFTPLYSAGNPYIAETYASLCAQTHADWEWLLLLNNGGSPPPEALADPRVRIFARDELSGVGALKGWLCSKASGEILFELDHDDALHPRALEAVDAEVSAGADFVYSDFAEFNSEAKTPNVYSGAYGWKAYPVTSPWGGALVAMRAPECTPQNLRSILWSPNHLRAWRRSFYESLGGHNAQLPLADDHDLVVRTYLQGGAMVHIPRCLYFYRVHAQQNVKTQNAAIQEWAGRTYDKHIYALAERFADERCPDCGGCGEDRGWHEAIRGPDCVRCRGTGRLLKVDLCGGIDTAPGYLAADLVAPGGIECDLNDSWPIAGSSVGVLRAFDAIEHLRDPVHTMNEAWRVLAPGGFMLIKVPSTAGPGAWCDPTHVSFWNRLSFRYYTDRNFSRYVRGFRGRFQLSRLVETGGEIPYVVAELVALKDGFSPMGEVLI